MTTTPTRPKAPRRTPAQLSPAEREISAMRAIGRTLEGLSQQARERVLTWTVTHYGSIPDSVITKVDAELTRAVMGKST